MAVTSATPSRDVCMRTSYGCDGQTALADYALDPGSMHHHIGEHTGAIHITADQMSQTDNAGLDPI